MITLKVLKSIKDSTVGRRRIIGEEFDVTEQRLLEMKKVLANSFDTFFLVIKAKKVRSK